MPLRSPRLAALALLALLLGGCGYTARRLSADLPGRTIAVRSFRNLGYYRDLELRLTQEVVATLRARTSLAIGDPGSADLVLDGEMEAQESVLGLDESRAPIQRRLHGSLRYTLTERATGRVIRQGSVQAFEEFRPDRPGESLGGAATDEWVRRLAERLVQDLESDI